MGFNSAFKGLISCTKKYKEQCLKFSFKLFILLPHGDSLRAGRCGDQIPVGGEIFRTHPDRPWGPPGLLYNGYLVFPGGKAAGAWR